MRIRLNSPLMLSQIATATDSPLNAADDKINFICTDTREIEAGDLFISWRGKNFDGSSFTEHAKSKGAYTLTESNAASIPVADSNVATEKLISFFKSQLKSLSKTVAITGSVGKTSCKSFLSRLLSEKYSIYATPLNLNNLFGLFYTVLTAPQDTEVLIVEMGMNNFNEIRRMSIAIKPDVAIITNVGTAHIGNLGSRQAIAKAKIEITDGMTDGAVVVPFSEPYLVVIKNKITYSILEHKGDAVFIPLLQNQDGTIFDFYFKGRFMLTERFGIGGEHNFSTFCSALTAASLLNINATELSHAIKKINSSSLRPQLIKANGFEIYDDTYSSSPEALLANAKMLLSFKKPISCVLGDMLELGEHSKQLHYKTGAELAKLGIKRLYLIGNEIMSLKKGALDCGMKKDNIHINNDIDDVQSTAQAIRKNYEGEILFIKASHAIHLERLIEILRKG